MRVLPYVPVCSCVQPNTPGEQVASNRGDILRGLRRTTPSSTGDVARRACLLARATPTLHTFTSVVTQGMIALRRISNSNKGGEAQELKHNDYMDGKAKPIK